MADGFGVISLPFTVEHRPNSARRVIDFACWIGECPMGYENNSMYMKNWTPANQTKADISSMCWVHAGFNGRAGNVNERQEVANSRR